jgi:histidinol-phosphate/aromatic aminotransferase/cobyric acid decarboxylase-like protein
MSSQEAVYVMQATEEEWVSPTPVQEAVAKALRREAEVDESTLESIEFNREQVAAVLDSEDEAVTFSVAGRDVTVHSSGDIEVDV